MCLLLGSVGFLQGFEYEVSSSSESFSKWGFNNQMLGIQEGRAPTESFATLYSQLNIAANLAENLSIKLGGAIGGIVFDSTANDMQAENPVIGSPVVSAYFGVSRDEQKIQNYMIHNAYLQYENEHFYFKIGRYEAGNVGQYFSGYNQGAEAYVKFSMFKLWGFWSNRIAFAYRNLFNDFFLIHGADSKNLQTYAIGMDMDFASFQLTVFHYFVPTMYIAPGIGLTYDTKLIQDNLRLITKANAIFPRVFREFVGQTSNNLSARDWGVIEKNTASIFLEQSFGIYNFSFGVGVYKNFGNANAFIGTYGNTLWLDIWTNTVYEGGQALNDIVSQNALTGFVYLGATYRDLTWQILGRETDSTRSAEQSLALNVSYEFRKDITIGGKIEAYIDTTKAEYNPLIGYYGDVLRLQKNRVDDRSHMSFYIAHHF
ncbi:outer membrane family protein [Helicobacter sp. 10-6591]|uniref:outer membrane family protein n=1 Tax=Helicobacter sp. 10-6591 TaxID=2004998 RepID=UPI00215D4A92|nr:outer membrane family protein [Helicobacter sp. 10-6591]